MVFSVNYWQITASHVQHTAQRPSAQPQKSAAPSAPAALPASSAPELPTASERHDALPFAPIYHRGDARSTAVAPEQTPAAKADAPSLADKVVRMMQASPNLTLEQVKAILKVDSFA